MHAARMGRTEIVKLLIDAGAKLDLQNVGKMTALMIAANNGHTEVVQLLIDAGATLDLQNVGKMTALM